MSGKLLLVSSLEILLSLFEKLMFNYTGNAPFFLVLRSQSLHEAFLTPSHSCASRCPPQSLRLLLQTFPRRYVAIWALGEGLFTQMLSIINITLQTSFLDLPMCGDSATLLGSIPLPFLKESFSS